MDNSHPTHGLLTFINGRFCEQSTVKMIRNHEHMGGGREGVGEFGIGVFRI